MAYAQRKFKLFNAGDRLTETLLFSNPDGHDIHVICRYSFDAPANGFVLVPEMVQVGNAQVHVQFVDDILKSFADRGVVLIDPTHEPPLVHEEIYDEKTGETVRRATKQIDTEADDAIPLARSDDEARAKGRRKWVHFCDTKVREHLEQCQQIRASGGVPLAASGFVKRALKLQGIIDPAEAMIVEAQKQTSAIEKLTSTVEGTKKENDELREQVKMLLARDAEREKAQTAKGGK